MKRRLKEAFRLLDINIPKNIYFVVIAKQPIVNASFEEIKEDLLISIEKIIEQNEKQKLINC